MAEAKTSASVVGMLQGTVGDPALACEVRIQILEKENQELRNTIKLILGRKLEVPWPEIPDSYVDGYLATFQKLQNPED